ncbi:MAG: FMN-binding negative transcriptional regulator [Proteobacteria bacterium]|nr:FMN-binding negative transcriptional regulator [Pseudomonadota bacterium]
MYLPKAHEESRIEVLHELMRTHPLGSMITTGKEGLAANHIPFLLDPTVGEFGTLKAHVARANPVWQDFSTDIESLVIFQGSQAYISPNWYPSKHEHGKMVPTWNYAVVHAYGIPKVVDDAAWLLKLIGDLTDTHEASQKIPWKVSDAPQDFTERMLDMIVGLEIPITKIIGKWKVSQNRTPADRLGVAAGLTSRNDDESRAMAALVMQTIRDQA